MYKQKTPLNSIDLAVLQLLEGSCMDAAEVSDKALTPHIAPVQIDPVAAIGALSKISEVSSESE